LKWRESFENACCQYYEHDALRIGFTKGFVEVGGLVLVVNELMLGMVPIERGKKLSNECPYLNFLYIMFSFIYRWNLKWVAWSPFWK